MSQFDYINRTYGLSLKRGSRCSYRGRPGTVVSSLGAHLNVRFDDDPDRSQGPFHPTWEMVYPPPATETQE